MEIIQAIILGIIQGITEWLPVSSSGHLVIFQHLFNISEPVFFEILLHLGSLLVILYVFWKDILDLIKGIFRREKEKLLLLLYLIIATIPIGIIGVFWGDYLKTVFNDLRIVGFGLLFSALILFLSKYPVIKNEKLDVKKAAIIGLFQGVAILPGVSRSGATISSGMMLGIKKKDVARFSFLLFIPAILGAAIMDIGELRNITNLGNALIGLVAAIIVGFFSLKLLLNIIKKGKFHYFSIYCLIVGIIVLLIYYI